MIEVIKEINQWLEGSNVANALLVDKQEWPALITHVYCASLSGDEHVYDNRQYMKEGGVQALLDSIPDAIATRINESPFADHQNNRFHFVDLFAGIGGFRLALAAQEGKCIFSSEWDKAAKETYFSNYGEYPFGDITKFTNNDVSDAELNLSIPDHQVLAAGFPCQPFSRAGVSARTALNMRHGFECETQGTLFYEVARIAAVKRPVALFLENVRNILSHDGGRTIAVIERTIRDLDYSFHPVIINAQSLVPQKRVRCYMIAIRNDIEDIELDLSPFEGPPLCLADILEEENDEVLQYQISERLWQGHITRTERNIQRGTGFTALLADIKRPSNTIVARYGKDGKECLIPTQEGPPRMLTKREAARLQGYPEDFILPRAKTPAYKQIGNSVAVPVVSELASQIIRHLDHHGLQNA